MNWQTRLFTLAVMLSVISLPQARADLVVPRADSGCTARNGDLFSPPTQSPQWAVDQDGVPIDLVQFYVHGPLLLLESLFVQQGWAEALPGNIPDDVVYGGSVVLGVNWVVQRMPVSPESLCGEKMITAYERDNDPLGGRRHFRIFSAGHDEQGRSVWALSVSRDTGLRFDPKRPGQLFINHSSEADEDFERDRVLQNLYDVDAIASLNTLVLAPTGYAADNDAYSGDGRVYDIVIR